MANITQQWGTGMASPSATTRKGKLKRKAKAWPYNGLDRDMEVRHTVQVVARNAVVFLRNGRKIVGCSITRYGKVRKPSNWSGDWTEITVRKVKNAPNIYVQDGCSLLDIANKLRY